MYTTLCLSGGGVNGLNILGSIKYLTDTSIIKPKLLTTFIGTSVGSIICVLLSIGYEINELIRAIYNIDFDKTEIEPDIDNLLENMGINDGKEIMDIVELLIYEKIKRKDITFKEHYDLTNKTIKLIAVNYNRMEETIFSHITTPDMSVLVAIRMSISIPLIFTPVLYKDELYIDGFIINNFGFNHGENGKTIGICLQYDINKTDNNVINYIVGLFKIFMKNVTFKGNDNVINLKLNNMTLEFNPDKKIKKQLLKDGYKYTKYYCNNNINFFSSIYVNMVIKNAINNIKQNNII